MPCNSRFTTLRSVVVAWLAPPAARCLFDAGLLDDLQRSAWAAVRTERRRRDFEVSRALWTAVKPESAPTWSLAHSDGYAAIATGTSGSLGIDIERCRPREAVGMAEAAFTAAEASYVASATSSEAQVNAFHEVWVLKEACAKALRMPLMTILRQTDFGPALSSRAGGAGPMLDGRKWSAWVYEPRIGLRLAIFLADVDADNSPRQHEWPVDASREWRPLHALTGPASSEVASA